MLQNAYVTHAEMCLLVCVCPVIKHLSVYVRQENAVVNVWLIVASVLLV